MGDPRGTRAPDHSEWRRGAGSTSVPDRQHRAVRARAAEDRADREIESPRGGVVAVRAAASAGLAPREAHHGRRCGNGRCGHHWRSSRRGVAYALWISPSLRRETLAQVRGPRLVGTRPLCALRPRVRSPRLLRPHDRPAARARGRRYGSRTLSAVPQLQRRAHRGTAPEGHGGRAHTASSARVREPSERPRATYPYRLESHRP